MDGYLSEIRIWASNFAPKGWAFCDGSILSIRDYTALFSLIGTTYGGDGRTTFALPDLRGRVPVGAGAGAGLTQRTLGEVFGAETATESTTTAAKSVLPRGGTTTVDAAGDTINVVQPSLGVTYIICVLGNFPSRS